MRIVPSYDLGPLGPGTGEPVVYRWHWHHNVPGLGLWIILALALVVPKANRRREVLPILVPVLLANAIWLACAPICQPVASDKAAFDGMVLSLTAGTMMFSIVGVLLWFLSTFAADGTWTILSVSLLGVILLVGVVQGACVLLVSLLFVLVGLRSPLFRSRLFACLRLPVAASPLQESSRS